MPTNHQSEEAVAEKQTRKTYKKEKKKRQPVNKQQSEVKDSDQQTRRQQKQKQKAKRRKAKSKKAKKTYFSNLDADYRGSASLCNRPYCWINDWIRCDR